MNFVVDNNRVKETQSLSHTELTHGDEVQRVFRC